MIVLIDESVHKTCLTLRQSGCEDATPDMSKWYVQISRIGCPEPYRSEFTPACGVTLPRRTPAVTPPKTDCYGMEAKVLEYDAFDDGSGKLCFYWDALLRNQPAGTYSAVVFDGSGCELTKFTIVLRKTTYDIVGVENSSSPC